MRDKYELTKGVVISLYVLIVSLIFWGMNKTDLSSDSQGAFFRFVTFFWGGGFAFHYLSVLLGLPAKEANWGEWKTLCWGLLKIHVVIGMTVISVSGIGKVFSYMEWPVFIGFALGLAVLSLGLWQSIATATEFGRLVERLREQRQDE
jgi:hypothetical protein